MLAPENPRIRLRPLQPVDRAAIESWPPYPGTFVDLDYALRPGGWLDEFSHRPRTWLYAAEQAGELVALTILAATEVGDAEFRITLHPDKSGQGLGRMVAARTLDEAFAHIGMQRIHLVVRKNNAPAIRLYLRLGFAHRGECRQVVNGRPVDFFLMDLLGAQWRLEGGVSPVEACNIDK